MDIVFQFILSSKESHTNFYVYNHIIKLDGPMWVPRRPHKQNQQDGKKGNFSEEGEEGGEDEKFLLVWLVNKIERKKL